jgi:hypothetical protein
VMDDDDGDNAATDVGGDGDGDAGGDVGDDADGADGAADGDDDDDDDDDDDVSERASAPSMTSRRRHGLWMSEKPLKKGSCFSPGHEASVGVPGHSGRRAHMCTASC